MNKVDNISRDSKILLDSARDSISNNLISAIKSGQIDATESQVSKLLTIVNVSIDEGYQRALGTFQNMIRKHVE